MKYLLYLSTFIFLIGCKSFEATPYDFPKPVDTTTRAIEFQEKKTYAIGGVYASNEFDGARLNDFQQKGENSFVVTIRPENSPINPSPWYAFKIWSDEARTVQVTLDYSESRHRYQPKISADGLNWSKLPAADVQLSADTVDATLTLNIGPDTLWVAGQELQNSTHVRQWCEEQAKHQDVRFSTMGESKLGRPMFHLDLYNGAKEDKETIVIFSRQHPPEVTGYFAMQAFIETILEDNQLANDFRKKYRLLVFPLMNPDGVDLGHWRHNAGGIDANRDWAYYNQPEARQVANYVVKTTKTDKNKVILGMDFHSTGKDIFYTFSMPSALPDFNDYWIAGIGDALGKTPAERESTAVGNPTTSGWFFTQFGAEGLTYEIGDHTPRDFIQRKGSVSAVEMMELLIYR
ncbi:MAG: M14 family zinc carboxypeptidase [Saprospiraceae bacterium]